MPAHILKHKEQPIIKPRIAMSFAGKSMMENSQKR